MKGGCRGTLVHRQAGGGGGGRPLLHCLQSRASPCHKANHMFPHVTERYASFCCEGCQLGLSTDKGALFHERFALQLKCSFRVRNNFYIYGTAVAVQQLQPLHTSMVCAIASKRLLYHSSVGLTSISRGPSLFKPTPSLTSVQNQPV